MFNGTPTQNFPVITVPCLTYKNCGLFANDSYSSSIIPYMHAYVEDYHTCSGIFNEPVNRHDTECCV